jgi:hypothetical protein
MIMDSYVINATSDSPKVIFNDDGVVTILGRSYCEDSMAFYEPILDYMSNFKAEKIEIYVRLEYMNTSSSIQIFNLLKVAKENQWQKSVAIKWFYDINDEDLLELGKEYEAMLNIPFEYFNTLDI